VRIYQRKFGRSKNGWFAKELVEAFEFTDAAVEFGGKARCIWPGEPEDEKEQAQKVAPKPQQEALTDA
jgi:hypothetical protein